MNKSKKINQKIFLPYTTFHVASLINSVSSGGLKVDKLFVLTGLGQFGDGKGSELYISNLEAEISRVSGGGCVNYLNIKSLRGLIFMATIFLRKFVFVTGNLRRAPSLYIGRYADSIEIVDDGSGTTRNNGYFNCSTGEKSKIKEFLIRLRMIDSYCDSVKKVECHYTIFSNSVYPNFNRIKMAACQLVDKSTLEKFPIHVVVYVSSSLRLYGLDKYKKLISDCLVRKNLNNSSVFFAAHPSDSENEISSILSSFDFVRLNTFGLLLEDFLINLAALGYGVTLIGEENTTTLILRSLEISGISIETAWIDDVS